MEEKLWESGLLGDHTPQVLVDTVLYLNFAQRSGEEHRRLQYFPCQFSVVNPVGTAPYIMYCEDISKTNQGGLKSQNWLLSVLFTMQTWKSHDTAWCSCFKNTPHSALVAVRMMHYIWLP